MLNDFSQGLPSLNDRLSHRRRVRHLRQTDLEVESLRRLG